MPLIALWILGLIVAVLLDQSALSPFPPSPTPHSPTPHGSLERESAAL